MRNDTDEIFVYILIIATVGLLVLGMVQLRGKSEAVEEQITEARQEIEHLEYENAQLRQRLDELRKVVTPRD